MIFFKILIFVVAGVVLLFLIKHNAPSLAVLGELTLVAIIVLAIVPEIENLISLFSSFQETSIVSEASLKIMLKTFGMLSIGSVVSDICRDNGESAVAGVVELSVKILAISCALPVFTAVTEIALTFFNR